MITDKLTIFGAGEDVTNICDLTAKCAEKLEFEPCKTVLYATDVCADQGGTGELVILPCDIKDKVSAGRVFTYSLSGDMADVTLLNLQNRENTTCFEVLSGTAMSRVYVPRISEYTWEQAFACVSVLCAWGVSVNSAVSQINSILK